MLRAMLPWAIERVSDGGFVHVCHCQLLRHKAKFDDNHLWGIQLGLLLGLCLHRHMAILAAKKQICCQI